MFARGAVYLHAACPERGRRVYPESVRRAHLPVPKSLTSKSSVSISSKLIETKGLQALCFGHLRKTGGRGSYQLVHTRHLPALLWRQNGRAARVQNAGRSARATSHRSPITSHTPLPLPLSLSSHSTPRLLRLPLLQRNLPISRQFTGARPAGMSRFAYRCTNALH